MNKLFTCNIWSVLLVNNVCVNNAKLLYIITLHSSELIVSIPFT